MGKPGTVETFIQERADRDGCVFFGLIDPANEQKSMEYVKAFEEAAADVILIGGSLDFLSHGELDNFIKKVKEETNRPILLFPGNINGVSANADATYFMSLLNSQNPYWIVGAHALAAPLIKKINLECIPTSLLVIDPGETVGWVGEARPFPYHKPELIAAYATAGELLGHRLTILERGSGAPGPASPETFSLLRKTLEYPVICAGSHQNLNQLEKTVKAGASGVHIASLIEKSNDPTAEAKKLVNFVKNVAKPR